MGECNDAGTGTAQGDAKKTIALLRPAALPATNALSLATSLASFTSRGARRLSSLGSLTLIYDDTLLTPVSASGDGLDANPDFNYRSFRTTNVLRWEYKPGSALFVVWQQGREDVLDAGRFQFGRDFGGVFGAPARNVFLVKWSYWINQ